MKSDKSTTAASDSGEFRIALAMRGGVSLAVWIGGAVAEVDLLRRAFHQDPESNTDQEKRRQHYRALLERKGFSSVKVDVLAGASAGGLNAVIYGVAQSAGLANLDWVKGVWMDHGGLWTLMHNSWNLRDSFGVSGLLRGDDHFYTSIRDTLAEQIRTGAFPARATDYLTVELSATLRDGPDLRRPEAFDGGGSIPRNPEAAFHFRRTPAPPGRHNDFPAAESDVDELRRLAYAARATSSFPGAFEPARIRSGRCAEPREPGLPGDMSDIFSEAGPSDNAEFSVVDGGVFDNIPIARALAAVADSPASTRTRRVLIYLDPTPPVTDATHVEAERSTRTGSDFFSSTVLHAVLMKVRTEEASDELAQIRDYNSETRLQLCRQARALDQISQMESAPSEWAQNYGEARADLDGDRVLALAVRPGLGLLRSTVPPLVQGLAITQQDALTRGADCRAKLRGRLPEVLAQDAQALAWLTTSFIASVRDRERADLEAEVIQDLGQLKKRLYLIRAAAQFLADLDDRATAGELLAADQTPGFDVTSVVSALAASEEQFWSALSFDIDAGDFDCAPLWQHLVEKTASDELQTSLPDWARGSAVALQIYGAVLVTMVGAPTAGKEIEFARITGDEEHPSLPDAVKEQALRDAVRIALSGKRITEASVRSVASRPLLRATTKLAGSELANFSGFLSKDWREHDWQWGRADAASALTRMLGELPDSGEEPEGEPSPGPSEPADAAQTGECGSARMVADAKPKQRFGDLPPGYRYALVAWLVQLLLRAIWPLRTGQMPTARNLVRAFTLMAARPLVIFVPLLARPAALAVLFATALASQRFESGLSATSGPLALRIVLGFVLVWAGFLLGRCAGLARRWALVRDNWLGSDQESDLEQVQLWAGARRKGLIFLLISQALLIVLGLLGLIWSLTAGRETVVTLLPLEMAAIAVAAVGLGEGLLTQLRRAPGAAGGNRDWLWVGLLLPVVLYLLNLGGESILDQCHAGTAVVALGAAIVAGVIHHAWVGSSTVVGAASFVGVVGFGALVLRQEWELLEDLDPRLGLIAAVLSVPCVFGGIVFARWTPPKSWVVALVLSTVFAVAGVIGVLSAWPEQPLPIALLIAGAVSAATTLFVPRKEELSTV